MRRDGFLAVVAACVIGCGATVAEQNVEQVTDDTAPGIIADIAAGERRYKRECRGCHGPTAKGMASYPKLVGHLTDYIVGRLEQYRAGEKLGPNTPLMAPRARKLSDEDIVNLAGFIASLSE